MNVFQMSIAAFTVLSAVLCSSALPQSTPTSTVRPSMSGEAVNETSALIQSNLKEVSDTFGSIINRLEQLQSRVSEIKSEWNIPTLVPPRQRSRSRSTTPSPSSANEDNEPVNVTSNIFDITNQLKKIQNTISSIRSRFNVTEIEDGPEEFL